jgi:hypothetical protein
VEGELASVKPPEERCAAAELPYAAAARTSNNVKAKTFLAWVVAKRASLDSKAPSSLRC